MIMTKPCFANLVATSFSIGKFTISIMYYVSVHKINEVWELRMKILTYFTLDVGKLRT